MFGYVIPCREKLTDAQWDDYRAAYCGLCHTLKRRYGFPARFLLNYDFTFLALLLRQEEGTPCADCRRCVAHPIHGRQARRDDAALDAAADASVLLAYWQARDQVSDERGVRRLTACLLLVFLFPVFHRGRHRSPELDREIGTSLRGLRALEENGCDSIDRTADQFAHIMTALAPQDWPDAERRPLEQLLYHMGRWIYLIDAWDDLEKDMRRGRYNPIIGRFGLSDLPGTDAVRTQARDQVERTIRHSENLAVSAFYLGTFGYSTPIVENVLCAGMPIVRTMVFSGTWKKAHRQKKQELNRL